MKKLLSFAVVSLFMFSSFIVFAGNQDSDINGFWTGYYKAAESDSLTNFEMEIFSDPVEKDALLAAWVFTDEDGYDTARGVSRGNKGDGDEENTYVFSELNQDNGKYFHVRVLSKNRILGVYEDNADANASSTLGYFYLVK